MGTRILAAIVGLAIVLPILIWGGVRGLDVLVLVVMLIATDEYARMTTKDTRRHAIGGLGIVLFGAMVQRPDLLAPVLGGEVVLLMVWTLLAFPDTKDGGRQAAHALLGLMYVPFLLSFVALLRRFEDGLAWIFLALAITWLGDTGAYFAGRAFGKHKLLERVSPKKTIEGAVGGLLLAIVGACAIKALALPNLPWVHAVALGALLDVAGVLGDLFESMLKRTHDVKDSGTIMPGHGGLLDRIDSLLFVAPVAWCYATAFGLA